MGLNRFIDSLILLISFSIYPYFATSLDTITSSYVLKAPQILSSNDGKFHLGFFTPPNSTYSYLGIWYMSETAVVWVANRNQPIKDSSLGQLKISDDGNLVVMNANKDILWSTNLTNIPSKTRAQLQNTGNLVLQENSTESILWQSFQHPTNTLLQKMELSTGWIDGERSRLTSWKSPQDPAIGEFSVSFERLNVPEMYAWRGSKPHWRSGPWNGQMFIGIPSMSTSYLNGNYVYASDGDNETYYIGFNYANQSLLLIHMLTYDGNPQIWTWDYANRQWNIEFSSVSTECDVYGKCGAFASCDPRSSPICSCLRGYEPSNVEEWNRQNWSSGCVRKKPLQCEGAINGEGDGFLVLQNAKVPASLLMSPSLGQDCRSPCLVNCSCIAYAYDVGIGCMLWIKELIDIQVFSNGGVDLYIRVPYSELEREISRARSRSQINVLGRVKLPDSELLQFEFQRLVAATNNFHQSNKIGQGGFGPVYKGTLEDGQEIAVKRLSRAFGQGYDEFMNEVMLISKLQHRNLVRLLGCCIEGDENILIYEYMPNKSLHAYMFESFNQILDWNQRFSIIEGIARGLLYLHRDSRLRIIHRDLKLSNILLDNDLTPKISDFGMAKIFSWTEDVINTRRIVGTFGYMSPEYAMEGLFSEKSDVFSFGVLLLEIVSRRKNTGSYEDAESFSLLGFAWNLWNADRIMSLVDPAISSSCNKEDTMRCIHIGLLCVQELARDRPTMTSVISMLNSETLNLPLPKQPAFIHKQSMLDIESSITKDGLLSTNYVSVTNIEAR
ncbi:hypothetical protein PIB30_010240 [Stylosanthes scabra]|uniref:Receptor-like serine/threonine-protein kinase n=1 Tax=Stylosanthes scabra TaxID=79078 RepID=A0ABU6S5B1_9FABA|nr:hypothetical protein [Stylosanthes scabra]